MKSPIDGGEAVPIGDNECSRPHFSPDGKYLSCVSEADKEMIILSAADGTEVRRFRVPTLATVNFGVRWTPTSDGVVFIHSDKDSSNLWVQPIDGREPTRLTNFTSGAVYNYAFSPVGGRLFIARGYPVQEVILIKDFM
jgi:Tol biopolymer transport system component